MTWQINRAWFIWWRGSDSAQGESRDVIDNRVCKGGSLFTVPDVSTLPPSLDLYMCCTGSPDERTRACVNWLAHYQGLPDCSNYWTLTVRPGRFTLWSGLTFFGCIPPQIVIITVSSRRRPRAYRFPSDTFLGSATPIPTLHLAVKNRAPYRDFANDIASIESGTCKAMWGSIINMNNK
jgi:hypothetical protein